jgi:hypothetical protein
VLLWVLGLTVLGADVLWYSPNARRHRYPWRLGASLHRLLPVIELSKEFTVFFDNPPPKPGDQPNLSRFQMAYFAGHAIAGWVLGFFLLAAMGGLTQKGWREKSEAPGRQQMYGHRILRGAVLGGTLRVQAPDPLLLSQLHL